MKLLFILVKPSEKFPKEFANTIWRIQTNLFCENMVNLKFVLGELYLLKITKKHITIIDCF